MDNFVSEEFDKNLEDFWDALSEEKKEAVMKAHDYFISNGIIADAFAAAGTPLNIL